MRLQSLKYPNNYKMSPGEKIMQVLQLKNDGMVQWPRDTHLIFSGQQNLLDVEEEFMVGAILPGNSIFI